MFAFTHKDAEVLAKAVLKEAGFDKKAAHDALADAEFLSGYMSDTFGIKDLDLDDAEDLAQDEECTRLVELADDLVDTL